MMAKLSDVELRRYTIAFCETASHITKIRRKSSFWVQPSIFVDFSNAVNIAWADVSLVDSVKSFGVTIDIRLTFDQWSIRLSKWLVKIL